MVAGVWAVAATAIGIIALLDTSDTDAEKRASDASDRASDAQRSLQEQDARIDALESRLDDLPQTADVSKLEDRLSAVEDDASEAAKDAKSADEKVADLEERVQTLEDAGRRHRWRAVTPSLAADVGASPCGIRPLKAGLQLRWMKPERRRGPPWGALPSACLDLIGVAHRAQNAPPEGPLPASTPDGATVGLRLTGPRSGLAAGHLQGP